MKKWQRNVAIAGAALLIAQRAAAKGSPAVLKEAKKIPNGGIYSRQGTGVPFDIVHNNTVILKKGDTIYCSGFTFAAAIEAAKRRGLLRGKTPYQLRKFQKEWYGVTGDTERQQGPALENLGIGKLVPHSKARPGDFLQIWRRNKSGHSVIFTGWLKDASGKKIGVKYRGAQSHGVGDTSEKFRDSGGSVLRERTYFSRLA